MALTFPSLGLAYFPVPKVACDSLKQALYERDTGRPFQPFQGPKGPITDIHQVLTSVPFHPSHLEGLYHYARFAVVRDPVERLLSCYRHRVVELGELAPGRHPDSVSAAALAEAGLPATPDLKTFIQRLPAYRAVSVSIRHHTDSLVAYLGADPGVFDLLVPLSRIDQVADLIAARSGRDDPLPRSHRSAGGVDLGDLDDDDLATVLGYYQADYKVFAAHISVPGIITAHRFARAEKGLS
ncbi:sulfotransferase family 2 domain-containing protein [Roseospirillum parvum]|uniref:Sulfotransferase family protein n=1 Tax=Roseospirillum parvum TaxID=83401 RepID=A0A1G7TW05_9PROT|nr:sulfotransferase family 2 domain-containing protein [Roseospirillum parvum]SDG39204.1 Sulfotransferase family protein [Roseospirillum parvum]